MEMKDRNRKMEEDFSRERLEIKSMIEKQASEITQMHLTQINRLQAALAEEVKRREQAEMARNEVLRGTANIGMDSSASYTYGSSGVQGGSDMTSRLMAEVRKREALEIENKNLLYEMNRYLTGTSHGDGESSPRDNKNDSTMKGSKRSKEGLAEKNRELLSEVEDLTDKVEEMEGRLKKNKELQRRNEALQEQVDEMNQKRDEMETAQKKIKKELSQLSAALEEVERRNRKLADELECQTRKVRDMDDSFRREKDSIKRRGEEEKAEAVGKVTKQKEEMERQLQEQISKMKQLEDNLQALQRTTGVNGSDVLYCTVPGQYSSPGGGYQTSASHHNGGYQAPVSLQGGTGNQSSVGGGFQTPVVQQGRRGYQAQRGDDQGGYQAFGGDRTQHLGSYADTLREEVSSLQALVLDAKKSYEDELKNLEKQRQEMREGFEKEKESLKQCFEDEKSQIETRLVQVETGTWNGVSGTPSGGTRGELGKGMYNPTVGQVKQPRSGQAGVTSQQSGRVGTPGNAEAEYFHARISELENANLELRQRLEQMQGGTSQATSERLGMSTGQRRAIGGDAGVVPRDADKTIGSTFSNPAAQTRSGGEQHRSRLKTNDQDPRARVSDLHIHFDGEGNHARPELHSEWSRTREGGCRNTSEHSQVSRAGVVGSRDHADMLSKIQTYSETIRKMTKEISSLKCERSAVRSVHKEQLKRQERTYEMEKIELREDLRRKHKEEVSRLRDEFDKKLALERKRLQSVIEELKRKVSSAERSAGELQRRLGDERQKFNNERLEIERTLLQSQEELKRVLEGDYRQRMNNEKQKFESTLQALSRQIGLLQEQRKQIQVKLVNSERSRETKTTANQEQMLYSLEQELLAKLSREKRPLEDQITWLQDEVSKLKREKTEIREKLERDKAELEEELERVRESMRTKLLRAREEMERRSSSSVNKVTADYETSMTSHVSMKQYQDQMNILEQRNLTLKSKNDRLERELRIMGDRLTSLETRQMSGRESMVAYRSTASPRRNIDTEIRRETYPATSRGQNYVHSAEGRAAQQYSSTAPTYYSDILDKVRETMFSTGAAQEQMGGPMLGYGGRSGGLMHPRSISGGTLQGGYGEGVSMVGSVLGPSSYVHSPQHLGNRVAAYQQSSASSVTQAINGVGPLTNNGRVMEQEVGLSNSRNESNKVQGTHKFQVVANEVSTSGGMHTSNEV